MSISKIRKLIIRLLPFAVMIFTLVGCDNFFNGSELQIELEKIIAESKARSVTIEIPIDTKQGITNPTGKVTCKEGKVINLLFEENNFYKFIEWRIERTDKPEDTSEIKEITIADKSKPETTVKIESYVEGIKIYPFCKVRPKVVQTQPSLQSNGISRDRSIEIEFASEIPEENFIFSEEEFNLIKNQYSSINEEDEEIPADTSLPVIEPLTDEEGKIYAYKTEEGTFFKNISIIGNSTQESLAEHFTKPKLVDGKYLVISTDRNNPVPVESGKIERIDVTVSKNIVDAEGIELAEEVSWYYKVTEVTDEKTEITFEATENSGKVTPDAGVPFSYSIGQKVKLNFQMNEGYIFNGWLITSDEEEVSSEKIEISDKNSFAPTITIHDAVSAVKIKAYCSKELTAVMNAPAGTSDNPAKKDSNIEIECNVPVSSECDLSQIKITMNGIDVSSNFANRRIVGNKIILENTKLLDCENGEKKGINVTLSKGKIFYYDGTKKVSLEEDSVFGYVINNETTEKAKINFEIYDETESKTINNAGYLSYTELNTFNVDEERDLIFEIGSDYNSRGYRFTGWKVTASSGITVESVTGTNKITVKNAAGEICFEIEDKNELRTKLKVLNSIDNVTIRAVCKNFPIVTSCEPAYYENGVSKDIPVELVFNHEISKYSIYYTAAEIEELIKKEGIVLLSTEREYVCDEIEKSVLEETILSEAPAEFVYAYRINGVTVAKGFSVMDEYNSDITSYYGIPVLSEENKKLTIPVSNLNICTFGIKKVTVTLKSEAIKDIADVYLLQDYDYSYIVNTATSNKLVVHLNEPENGVWNTKDTTVSLNIGDEYTFSFMANKDYVVDGWHVLDLIGKEVFDKSGNCMGELIIRDINQDSEPSLSVEYSQFPAGGYGTIDYSRTIQKEKNINAEDGLYYVNWYSVFLSGTNVDGTGFGQYVETVKNSYENLDNEKFLYGIKESYKNSTNNTYYLTVVVKNPGEIDINIKTFLVPVIEKITVDGVNVSDGVTLGAHSSFELTFSKPFHESIDENDLVKIFAIGNCAGYRFMELTSRTFFKDLYNVHMEEDRKTIKVFPTEKLMSDFFYNEEKPQTGWLTKDFIVPVYFNIYASPVDASTGDVSYRDSDNKRFDFYYEDYSRQRKDYADDVVDTSEDSYYPVLEYKLVKEKKEETGPYIINSTVTTCKSNISLPENKITTWDSSKLKMMLTNKICIKTFDVYDSGSGAKDLYITETLINDTNFNDVTEDDVPAGEIRVAESVCDKDENNNALFERVFDEDSKLMYSFNKFSLKKPFTYEFKTTEDGIVKIEIQVRDCYGNKSAAKTYYALKDTTFNNPLDSNIEIYASLPQKKDDGYSCNLYVNCDEIVDVYMKKNSTTYLKSNFDNSSYTVRYGNNGDELTSVENKYSTKCTEMYFSNVEKIGNVYIDFEDEAGNVDTVPFNIPQMPKFNKVNLNNNILEITDSTFNPITAVRLFWKPGTAKGRYPRYSVYHSFSFVKLENTGTEEAPVWVEKPAAGVLSGSDSVPLECKYVNDETGAVVDCTKYVYEQNNGLVTASIDITDGDMYRVYVEIISVYEYGEDQKYYTFSLKESIYDSAEDKK